MTHFIGMAGLYGCLPSECHSFETAAEATEYFVAAYDLDKGRAYELRRDHDIALDLDEDGNQYISITACNCDEPAIHEDN